jgi:hypothetical protein
MSASSEERLIVFTRLPVPGRVKTRLIPALGPEGAAQLHCRLSERTLALARRLAQARGLELEVRYLGGSAAAIQSWLGEGPLYRPQGEGDLGARMSRALHEALAGGVARVVLVGCDVPELSEDILHRAFQALRRHPLVLGPAADGGYYLVGLSRPAPRIFRGVNWGTARVLAQTRSLAAALGLKPVLLPVLSDVDRPEDLEVWERVARSEPASS